jgi:hypothetical protein
MSNGKQPTGIVKWYHRVGWTLGILISIIFPRIDAPLNLTLAFTIGGTVSALLGFSLMYAFLKRKSVSTRARWGTVAAAAIAGLIAMQLYRTLLLRYTTPNTLTMWTEFALFCVGYFGLFALLAFVYRNGGLFVLQKLGKVSV